MATQSQHLVNLLQKVIDPQVQKENKIQTMKELDSLAHEKGQGIDPELKHFLQRRSYEKALSFLKGQKQPDA